MTLRPDDGGHAFVWVLLVQGVIIKVEPVVIKPLYHFTIWVFNSFFYGPANDHFSVSHGILVFNIIG
jgi:hypothetical protein